MPRLPQTRPTIQITGPIGTRTSGARSQGRGLSQLGQSLQHAAGQMLTFQRQVRAQEQQTLGNQLATDKLVSMQEKAAILKRDVDNPDEAFTEIQTLITDMTTIPDDVKQQLGPDGVAAYSRIVGAQAPGYAQGLFNYQRGFAQAHLTQKVENLTETYIRDIAAALPPQRPEMIEQFVTYMGSIDAQLIPDRSQRLLTGMTRLAGAIASSTARRDPERALAILDQGGEGFTLPVDGVGVFRLSREEIDGLYRTAYASLQREQAARVGTEQAMQQKRKEENRLLVTEVTRMQLADDPNWRVLAERHSGGNGFMGVPLLTAANLRAFETFDTALRAKRTAGEPSDPRVVGELLIQAHLGQIDNPYQILDATGIDSDDATRLINVQQTNLRRSLELGTTRFNAQVKRGVDVIENSLGVIPSTFMATADPELGQIINNLKSEYLALADEKLTAIEDEFGTRGTAFKAAVRQLDLPAMATEMMANKFNVPDFLEDRVAQMTKTLAAQLRPYVNDPATFQTAIDRDLAAGVINRQQAATYYLIQQQAAAKGFDVQELFQKFIKDPAPGEAPQATTAPKRRGLLTKLADVIRDIMGLSSKGGAP